MFKKENEKKNDIDAILAVLNPILMICFSVSQMANINNSI